MYRSKLIELGIDIPQGKRGKFKTKCPKCGDESRKKNRKDLTVNVSDGWYKCHSGSCDFVGKIFEKAEYKRPKWIENTSDLSFNAVKMFSERGISEKTLVDLKITIDRDVIHFNYFRDSELVNWKGRNISEKRFSQFEGAEHILYNLDSLKDKKKAILVEGEIDVLSWHEAGLSSEYGIVSIDQGAGAVGSKLDGKLQCLENCALEIDGIEEWYLALDNDDPGQYTQREVIRRLGEYRCSVVEFSDRHKDANDVLQMKELDTLAVHQTLRELIKNAKTVPVKGIVMLDDEMRDRMLKYYDEGWPIGTPTYFDELDQHFKFLSADITLFTGIPGDGKGTFIRQLALLKAVKDDWKWACYVPEDFPVELFYEDLCHAFIGKTADKRYDKVRMTKGEFVLAMDFIRDHFFCIYPEPDHQTGEVALPSNEWINKRIRFLKLKYGVNAYIKDPWNKIYHNFDGREDQYLMSEISKEKFFAASFDAALYVAHPAKMPKEKDGTYAAPTAYQISGGAMFFNMFDNILTVFRPNRFVDTNDMIVHVIIQKIKKQKQVGRPGTFACSYDFKTNRYKAFDKVTDMIKKNPLESASSDVLEEEIDDLPF